MASRSSEASPRILKMLPTAETSKGKGPETSVSTPSKRPLRICVFCSRTTGTGEAHLRAARALAQCLSANGAQLVYGGGTVGLMGELAKTFVSLSGPQNVHGIIPRDVLPLERPKGAVDKNSDQDNGVRHKTWKGRLGLESGASEKKPAKGSASRSALLSESVYGRTTVVTDLPARKKMMCRLVHEGRSGSGFIALSGGFGTMDELVEMVTLRQHGVHKRRVALLNIDGFWDPLLAWMETAIERGFVKSGARDMLAAKDTAEECIAWLRDG